MPGFRIVVAAHGPLAAALVASAEMICGPLPDVRAVGIEAHESPDQLAERIRSSVDDPSQPVLFLTDMVGGTPHNVVVSTLRVLPRGVCLSGVNLAVLVEAATSLQSLDAGAIDQLVATGRNSIVAASRRKAGEAE